MKSIVFILIFMIFSCQDKTQKNRILSNSSGNINNVSVVIDNLLWKSKVGNMIKSKVNPPLYGLPQEEPLFSLRQIPPEVFSGFVKKSRLILKIEKSKNRGINFAKNLFAKPQLVVLISGKTDLEIIEILTENSDSIIRSFNNEEIKEKKRRIRKSLFNTKDISKNLKVKIDIPSAYRTAKIDSSFFWFRRDIRTGTLNLLLYEIPWEEFYETEKGRINRIIKIRDSVGKKHIHGVIDGTYLVTESSYIPFNKMTRINNIPTIITRSTWKLKNAFMGGPFINYAILDKTNNRILVAEGFVFAPSEAKRNYVFELEVIINSIRTISK